MKKYRIDLPAKAVENLELEKNTSLVLMVDNKTLTIRPSRTVEMLPQIMMRWYLIPAVLAAVIFFCLSWSNHHWVISLTGQLALRHFILERLAASWLLRLRLSDKKDIAAGRRWSCIGVICRRC